LRTTIGLHYNVPPARAEAVLTQAAATVPGVCAEPPPQVYVKEFAASAVTYEIKFWIQDHSQYNRITGDVLSHCWYAARRAGMEIPFPIVTLHRPEPRDAAGEARKIAAAALRAHSVFNFLPAAQIDELVELSPVVLFAAGEYLVEQGAEGNSMFLLVRGRVEVRQKRETGFKVLTHLGPGDCLGEMAVLTGEKRSASVQAQGEVEAVEITHQAFSQLIGKHPEVPSRLSEMLAQRQLANEKNRTQGPFPEKEAQQARDGILRRLKAFFHLGG
jgi:CRP-like cAMP-binding protein